MLHTLTRLTVATVKLRLILRPSGTKEPLLSRFALYPWRYKGLYQLAERRKQYHWSFHRVSSRNLPLLFDLEVLQYVGH